MIDNSSQLTAMINAHKRGRSLDRTFYASSFVYERDIESIWSRHWLWAGHANQIPNPGDYFLYEFGNESIIVVRDERGDIRAHNNVCRHRGSRVCLTRSGNAGVFSCPYHGWTYRLDGGLRAGRAMADDFDPTPFGLFAVNVTLFHGLIFVNTADDPPNLTPALDRLNPYIEPFAIARTKVAHTTSYRVFANWKLALENYLECYHCAPAHKAYSRSHSLKNPSSMHPDLIAKLQQKSIAAGLIADEINAAGLAAKPIGADIYYRRYPLYEGYVTGSEDGEPLAPLLGNLASFDGGATDIQIGPVNHFLAYSDHVVGYRFIPRGIQETEMQVVWLVREDAVEGVDYSLERLTWLWDITTKDDERIIRHNQAGVNSSRYQPGPLSTMEWGITDFLDWYLRVVGAHQSGV